MDSEEVSRNLGSCLPLIIGAPLMFLQVDIAEGEEVVDIVVEGVVFEEGGEGEREGEGEEEEEEEGKATTFKEMEIGSVLILGT